MKKYNAILIGWLFLIQASLFAVSPDSLLQQLQADPENSEIMSRLGRYYMDQQDYNEAIKWVEKALSEDKKRPDKVAQHLLLLGKIHASRSSFDTAIQYYKQVLDYDILDTSRFIVYKGLGDCYNAQHDPERSREWYEKAFDMAGSRHERAGILNHLGSLYWQVGRFSNAIEIYDSALQVLGDHQNKLGIKLINNKATCYRSASDFTNALSLHRKSMEIAKSIKDTTEQANTLNFIGSTHYRNNKYDSALIYYHQVLDIRKNETDSSGIFAVFLNLARTHERLMNYDSALVYNQKALQHIARQEQAEKSVAVHNNLGNIYYEKGEYAQSASHYFQSLQRAHTMDDHELLAQTYNRLSQLFSRVNNFERALEYLSLSIDQTREIGNKPRLAYRLNQLGNLYFNNTKYQEALEYYQQALAIHKSLDDQKSIAQTLNNLGNANRETGNHEIAIKQYRQAHDINRKIEDHIQEAYTLNNLGNIYQLRNDPATAQKYYQQAYTLSKDHKVHFIHSLVSRKLGEHYYKNLNDDQQAEGLLLESLETGRNINHQTLIKNALYQLYQLEHRRNNFRKALEYYEEYAEVEKNVLMEANNQRIFEQQLQFALEQKQDTIQAIESQLRVSRQKQELKALEAQKYKQQRQNLFILILVFMVAGMVITYLFIQLRRKNRLIDEAYTQSTAANLKLKKSETVLKELVATKDKFFSIIAHDLRGPIASLMNLTEVLSDNYDELTDQELKEANESIHESAGNLYTLLENLLHWSRIQTGRIQYKPTTIELHDLVQNNMGLLKMAAHEKQIVLSNNIKPGVKVRADKEMIDTVLRNLINNALKFTHAKGTIHVSATETDDHWRVQIEDTGVGMSPEMQKNLFRVDKQVSMSGTNNESGTGLGLILCKEFIQKNNGDIWVESEPDKGTTFYFTLPNLA